MTRSGLMLAFAVSGCRGLIEIPPQSQQTVIVPAAAPAAGQQTEILQAGGVTEIIEPRPALCAARAKHFKGLVSVPCEQIAREISP